MTCPNLYIGDSLGAAPPTPFWQNPAIQPPVSITEGSPITISVFVRNNGTDDAPATLLQLFWSDPTTGFVAVDPGRKIGEVVFPTILGATTPPPEDGVVSRVFAWTPGADAASLNGGHVCLLARAAMQAPPGDARCAQQAYTAAPSTDARSGIRNIHVIGGAKKMAFAFAATNTLLDLEKTKLFIRALDPKKDRKKLEALVADPMVDEALSARQVKLAAPKGVRMAPGRERYRVPLEPRKATRAFPTFSKLGPLSEEQLKYMIEPQKKLLDVGSKPIELNLLPGERHQTLVQVEPREQHSTAYVVEIDHQGADGRPIGGLTLVFISPRDHFA